MIMHASFRAALFGKRRLAQKMSTQNKTGQYFVPIAPMDARAKER